MAFDVRPLKEICSHIVDCPHSTPFWTDSGFIVIRNQNIKVGRLDLSAPSYTDAEHFAHRTRRAKPSPGDIVFTREAPMGEVCMVPKGIECCLGQRQVLLRPDPKSIDGRYLLFALQSPRVQNEILWSEGTGSTVSNVRIPVLEALKIPVPPLSVQREIGDILGSIDDQIELLRDTNTTLEAIAQAIFKSWFIDFDPVKAKSVGRIPDGIDEATAAQFPDSFQESPLGAIPKGWTVSTIGGLCSAIFSGGTPSTSRTDYWNGDLRWLSSGETRDAVIIDTEKRISFEAVNGSSTRLALPGDVVIASAGQGKTRGQTSFCAIETYVNQSVVALRADPTCNGPSWLFYNLSRRYEEMRMLSDSHSIRGSLTTKLLAGMKACVPPYELIKAFEDLAGPLLQAQAANLGEAHTLTELRDALLPRLISGKLKLPELQEVAEAL